MSFIANLIKWKVARFATNSAAGAGLLSPSGDVYATLGPDVITSGLGGRYPTVQAAIDSITDNLPVTYTTGTVNLANLGDTATFSVAPGLKLIPGLDLMTIDGVRFYQFKKGPSAANGLTFTLNEPYQGAANATAAFQILRPNPRTVLMLPGMEQTTTASTLADLKPFVSLIGVDPQSCIIRRWVDNPSLVPLIKLKHGCFVDNITIDSVDGHFDVYRMGLTAPATSETQAMKGSRWEFGPGVKLLNGDPHGVDTGSDYWLSGTGDRFNDDLLVFNGTYFSFCWDALTTNHEGTGKLSVVFNNPIIEKIPYPQKLAANVTGCTFFRAQSAAGTNVTEVVFNKPYFDQRKYAAGEAVGSGFAGSDFGFSYGMLYVAGAASKAFVVDPTILMDVGTNTTDFNGGLIARSSGTIEYSGGYYKVDGAGSGTNKVAPVINSGGVVKCVNPGREMTVAFAATITPDANVASILNIGTLTGNTTIAAPLNPLKGQALTINYVQDATGSRTITYNAIFKATAPALGGVSQVGSHSFIYNGTNWVQTGGALVWL